MRYRTSAMVFVKPALLTQIPAYTAICLFALPAFAGYSIVSTHGGMAQAE